MASKSVIQPDQAKILRVNDEIQMAKYIIYRITYSTAPAIENKKGNKVKEFLMKMLLSFYTGRVYPDRYNILKKKPKRYIDWVKNTKEEAFISKKDFRKALYNVYVTQLNIANRQTLLIALININGKYKSLKKVQDMFENDMKMHGYIWKRLGYLKRYIIVENTELVARRMRFLYQMMQIRDDNRAIVYVALRSIDVKIGDNNTKLEIAVAVSPQAHLIDALITTSEESSINIDGWLNEKLNTLPEDTAFVVEQSPELQEDSNVPTEHSKKKHMIDWLEFNEIPYDPNLHKCDLYTLIEKYKARGSSKRFQLLTANKYTVLFRPRELWQSNFDILWDKIEKHLPMADTREKLKLEYNELVTEIPNEEWRETEIRTADFEELTLTEDCKLELIIDNLTESIKNGNLNESDFAHCEEDVFDDEYVDSILTK